jgi:subtilisin family serine protease
VTYTVAAGNSAANARDFVPASYDEVITVSALADFNGQPAAARRRPAGPTATTPSPSSPTSAPTST